MISYKDNDPKGWCGDPARGAALGRSSRLGNHTYNGKLRLCRIYLNNGGYDCNGTYFGSGKSLFWYASEDGEIDCTVRADNREQAKQIILGLYPNVRFFR